MCKVISNRIIIGNFLIEVLNSGATSFNLDEFIKFDRILSKKLSKLDYYSCFDDEGILEFVDNYPFVTKTDSDCITIVETTKNKETMMTMLDRFFRIGISEKIIEVIDEVSKEVLKETAV